MNGENTGSTVKSRRSPSRNVKIFPARRLLHFKTIQVGIFKIVDIKKKQELERD